MTTNELALVIILGLIRGTIQETKSTKKYVDFSTRVARACQTHYTGNALNVFTNVLPERAKQVKNFDSLDSFDLFFKGIEDTFEKQLGKSIETERKFEKK